MDTTEGNILFSGNKAEDASEGGADIYLNTGGSTVVNIRGDANVLAMDGGFPVRALSIKPAGIRLFSEKMQIIRFFGESLISQRGLRLFTRTIFWREEYRSQWFGFAFCTQRPVRQSESGKERTFGFAEFGRFFAEYADG